MKQHKMPLVAVSFMLAAALIALGTGIYKYAAKQRTYPFQDFNMAAVTENGQTMHTAISPDGRFLAYVLREGGGRSLRLKQLATGSDVELVPSGPGQYGQITFSPDGNYVFYEHQDPDNPYVGEVLSVPSLGGPTTHILTDGAMLKTFPTGFEAVSSLKWLPDSSGVSYVAQKGASSNIYVQSLAGGPLVQKTNFTSDFVIAYAWSPDGKKVIMTRTHTPRDAVILADTTKAD